MASQYAQMKESVANIYDHVHTSSPNVSKEIRLPLKAIPTSPSSISEVSNSVLQHVASCDTLSLKKQILPTTSSQMAGLLRDFRSSPDFDYHCNPAASDCEVIICEMVREHVGLNTVFSMRETGLGKISPYLNEALLLCYHSTVYTRPQAQEYNLVVYGVAPHSPQERAFRFRNVRHLRPFSYTDEFEGEIDLAKLEQTIKADKESGLIPHFLFVSVKDAKQFIASQHSKLDSICKEHGLKVYLDFSEVGLQVMERGLMKGIEPDFASLDLTELCGLSSLIFYIKDRRAYKEKVVNPPQEYLKIFNAKPSEEATGKADHSSDHKKKLTEIEFTAHDYNVGFGNPVALDKMLACIIKLGRKGLAHLLQVQRDNVELILSSFSKCSFVKKIRPLSNHVEVLIEPRVQDVNQRIVALTNGFSCFEFDSRRPHVLSLHAPLVQLDQSHLQSLQAAMTKCLN